MGEKIIRSMQTYYLDRVDVSIARCSLLIANCSLLIALLTAHALHCYTATPLHKADTDMRRGKHRK